MSKFNEESFDPFAPVAPESELEGQTLGSILNSVLPNPDAEKTPEHLFDLACHAQQIENIVLNNQDKINCIFSKLAECAAAHFENNDHTGANAILNALGCAQQS